MKIFLASPLGFAESTKGFLPVLCKELQRLGYEVVNPWEQSHDLEKEFQQAESNSDLFAKRSEFHRISMRIAERNANCLCSCDGVLAVLDGADVDSGTASEIGYAFGLGNKVINGYRGDFRRAGENVGVLVNLQVQYWIEQSGGKIVTSIGELSSLNFTWRDCIGV
ncbi:MAG: 2-deoxyribonucleoside glycosidase [Candidatus Omnitrophota bacterium]|jgi:nucleoside 2-deoxyribosyltransferase|nr:MAG: 2-deoxyribonucleoside glycosidase [Candidatus Omnitrophota bacterium]